MPTNMAGPSVFSQESDVWLLLRLVLRFLLGVLLSAAAATAIAAAAGDLLCHHLWPLHQRS